MNPETHTCDCGYTWHHGQSGAHSCGQYYRQTIAELRAAAAPQVVADERAAYPGHILETATELARCIYRDNYKNEAPGWEPLPDLAGVLSQIDNMVCGMRRAAPVQAQEPVAWRYEWASCITGDGPQNFKLTFDVEPPPEWAVEDGQARNVVKLFGAPVQPVAVPDNWRDSLVGLHVSMDVSTGEENGGDRIFGEVEEVMVDGDALVLLAVESSRNFATPAAQGDAKDAERYRWLRDKSEPGICAFYLSVGRAFDGVKFNQATVDEAIDAQIAAIAAKAANK